MNKHGERFLSEVRKIIDYCSGLESPERAARVTAFSIMVLLDGSGEGDLNNKVVTIDNEDVEFFHHEL
jgi:hypothetical protein